MNNLSFSGKNLLVVGDVMLDKYYIGKVERISPEAPVPVVKVAEERHTLGGAGNVINNIIHLGANCLFIGTIGKDGNGRILKRLLKVPNVQSGLLEIDFPTITKARIIGDHQQVVRLDFEKEISLDTNSVNKMFKYLEEFIKISDIVIISDYGKGMCSEDVCRKIINIANKFSIPTVIDPKGNNWNKYKGATFVTPNLKELSEISGSPILNEDDQIRKYAEEIIRKFNIKNILVTRSAKGMSLISKNCVHHFPTHAREVFDVSGAGDTVVAVLAAALANNVDYTEAVKLSNKAAGIVVGKFGTAPIEIDELYDSVNGIEKSKIVTLDVFKKKTKEIKNQDKKIVFTNGCFDILHKGHVTYLKEARNLGDILVLGLNSDHSVRRIKGNGRPVNRELDRAEVLAGLEFIDYIIIFNEDTPRNLIKTIKPDILVKGGDYSADTVVGREFAKQVVILPFIDGYSTTDIIKKTHNQ